MKTKLCSGLVLFLVLSFVLACQPAAPAVQTPSPTPVSKITQAPTPVQTGAPGQATPVAKTTQAPPPPPAEPAKMEKWRLATAEEGTTMYSVGVALARVVNKYVKGVELTASPVPASAMSHQLLQKGEVDITYGGGLALGDVWTNKGLFEKQPVTFKAYNGIYLYTGEQFLIVGGDNKDINKYADLAGKRMFPMTSASAAFEVHKLVLSTLGIWDKIQDRQMGTGEAAEAIRTGKIDAIGCYGSSGTLAPWMKELELRVDLRVVNPSESEKEAIKKIAGLAPVTWPASVTFTKPVGVKEIWGVMSPMGFQFGPHLNADLVAQVVKAWYEHSDELAAIAPAFAKFHKEGIDFNLLSVNSLADIPVHPGVAKYYKERGVWNNAWKIGETKARP